MTRRTLLQLTPAAALAAQAPTPAGTRLRTRTSKEIGASPLSIGFETLDRKMFDPERCYPHLARLGVKWARCQTGWARTETRRGEYDFAWLDSVVDNLLRAGVQPWFNLGYGNRVYTPGPTHESAVGWIPVNNQEARQAWLRYVGALAEHFAKRVSHWEIWNEPNISGFWQPNKPDPKIYAEFVKVTVPVIRRRIPRSTIIGGAFAGLPFDYIEDCFAAGMGEHIDKVSYHPYRAQPELRYAPEIRALRAMVARYKPGVALWQGENGAPSTANSAGALRDLPWNEARQARWLLRRILTDLSLDIEVTSYFHTVDMVNYVWAAGASNTTNFKGVLRGTEYTPKPSYFAYQNLCALFDAETKHTDFLLRFDRLAAPLQEPDVYSAAFVRRGRALYAYWQVADLMKDTAPSSARMIAWSGGGAKLEDPVLVDPLSGEIAKLPKASRSGGSWTFDALPVRDYPMLIADRSLVA